MRAFIAIDLSNDVKQEIERNQFVVKDNCSSSRVTSIGNLHITLKFLGDISDEQFGEVKEIMSYVASRHKAFSLILNKWGSFRSRKGNIVWLGVDGDLHNLNEVVKNLSKRLAKISSPNHMKFTPHITVARDAITINDINMWQQPKNIKWNINHIALYESVSKNNKVAYKVKFKAKLNN